MKSREPISRFASISTIFFTLLSILLLILTLIFFAEFNALRMVVPDGDGIGISILGIEVNDRVLNSEIPKYTWLFFVYALISLAGFVACFVGALTGRSLISKNLNSKTTRNTRNNKALIKKNTMTIIFTLLALAGLAGSIKYASIIKPPFNSASVYEKIGRSKADLISYKKLINDRISSLQNTAGANERIYVTITFNKYVSRADVDRLVRDYSLNIRFIMSRTAERGTIGEVSYKGKHRRDFIGFIEAVAYVPNKKLVGLAHDKLIFLVDPSADKHFALNLSKDYMQGVFWHLEDFDMVRE